jgi:hypothetical protein
VRQGYFLALYIRLVIRKASAALGLRTVAISRQTRSSRNPQIIGRPKHPDGSATGACLLHRVDKCPGHSRAYGFLLPTTIISTDSKNDHPANSQVAIDAHCKRLPIAPDHPTTNVQPAIPSGMSVCGPTRDIQSPKLLCCTSCSAELQNAKYSQQRAEIIFKHDRHKAASQNLTLRETSHVRRLCRRPVRRRCRVRQVEGGVGAGGRSLEWSMGSRVWQRYRKHDHFGPDFHPLI